MPYRTALVTGASSGIGAGLSRRLARDGVHVVLCARRTDKLEAVSQEIVAAGGSARVVTLDVSDIGQTVAAIRQIDDDLGGLDLVVANAGVGGPRPSAKITWESIAPMLAVNFTGAIATLTAVLPQMLKRRSGHLVAMSSLAAITGLPSGAPYCGTKAGLSMFLESLRFDLLDTGVRVTTIQPGAIKTPMSDKAKHPPPLIIPCDEAVDRMVDALEKAPAVIEFPFPMSAALHTIAALPRTLRDAALRRFPVPEED